MMGCHFVVFSLICYLVVESEENTLVQQYPSGHHYQTLVLIMCHRILRLLITTYFPKM